MRRARPALSVPGVSGEGVRVGSLSRLAQPDQLGFCLRDSSPALREDDPFLRRLITYSEVAAQGKVTSHPPLAPFH